MARVCALLLLCALSAAPALAQRYPTKPVRLVVGFAAGGPTEVAGRVIAQKLADKLHQPFVVDVRPGAGGNIAAEIVAKSASDGYTLLIPAFAHAVNPALHARLPFDTTRDFAPVALFASAANILAIHPSIPARSIEQFITLAKAQTAPLTFGSAGNGTASHLAGELFNMMTGTKLVHVPYKGSAPASADLIGGHIAAAFPGVAIVLPHTRAGRLRALGITSLVRSKLMPEVPTLSEAGLPGFEVISWYGVLAPAGVARDVVEHLNAEVNRSVHEPDAMDRLASLGAEPVDSTPDGFGRFIGRELAKWSKVVHAAGLKID
ncbi:MAG TPA: tripartite tricarboxylate transporter substrate binding protein [Burkholderiales bacterium]|nr:tripartite tricarboxylate transporter substrate binding protein [Burkholderiales bacterium]